MGFDDFVRKHGSREVYLISTFKDFPIKGDWRSLKIFINSHRFEENANSELEDLRDRFWIESG